MQYGLRAQRPGFGDGGGERLAMIVAVGNDADFQDSPPAPILHCAAQSIFYDGITFFSLGPYPARLKSPHSRGGY
jgi:hypothetical protein